MTGFEEAAALAALAPEAGTAATAATLPSIAAPMISSAMLPASIAYAGLPMEGGAMLGAPSSFLGSLLSAGQGVNMKDALMFNSAMHAIAPQQPQMAGAPSYRPQQVQAPQLSFPQPPRDRRHQGLLAYLGGE